MRKHVSEVFDKVRLWHCSDVFLLVFSLIFCLKRTTVLPGVHQGAVLGPLLFSLYINDISSDIESKIRLFADDCVCFREIKDEVDTMKLQRDIDRLGS